MKSFLAFFVVLTLVAEPALAWTFRPAFNEPTSVVVEPSIATPLGTYFREPGYPSNNFNSRVMSTLNDKGYTHIQFTNEIKYPLSCTLTADGSSAPSSTVSKKIFIPSSGFNTVDDISIFKYMYCMSENGDSPREGKLKITVW